MEPKAAPAAASTGREQDFNSVLKQQSQRDTAASTGEPRQTAAKLTGKDTPASKNAARSDAPQRADASRDASPSDAASSEANASGDKKVSADQEKDSAAAVADSATTPVATDVKDLTSDLVATLDVTQLANVSLVESAGHAAGETSDTTAEATEATEAEGLISGDELLRHLEASLNAKTGVSGGQGAVVTPEMSAVTTAGQVLAAGMGRSATGVPAGEGKSLPQDSLKAGSESETSSVSAADAAAPAADAGKALLTSSTGQRTTDTLPWSMALNALSTQTVPSSPDDTVDLSALSDDALAATTTAAQSETSSSLEALTAKLLDTTAAGQGKSVAADSAAWLQTLNTTASASTAQTASSLGAAATAAQGRGTELAQQLGGSLQLLNSQQAAPELAQTVTLMMGQKWQEAEIQLEPHGLGKLRIQLTVDQDQQTSVHFVVQHGQTRDLLEQAMPRLRDMLAGQGLQLGQSSIQQQDAGQAGGQQLGQSGQSGRGEDSAGRGTRSSAEEDAGEGQIVQNLAIHSTGPAGIDFYA